MDQRLGQDKREVAIQNGRHWDSHLDGQRVDDGADVGESKEEIGGGWEENMI